MPANTCSLVVSFHVKENASTVSGAAAVSHQRSLFSQVHSAHFPPSETIPFLLSFQKHWIQPSWQAMLCDCASAQHQRPRPTTPPPSGSESTVHQWHHSMNERSPVQAEFPPLPEVMWLSPAGLLQQRISNLSNQPRCQTSPVT